MKKILLLFKEFWNCLINCGNVKEETGATLYASIFSFIIAMVNFFALFTFSNQLNWQMTQAISDYVAISEPLNRYIVVH